MSTFWQRWLFNPDINPQDPRHFHAYTNPYPARPTGQNGTQQFAKLSDSQLFKITRQCAASGFWKDYYNRRDEKQSTRRIVDNLPTITKEAVDILQSIQKQYGYTPHETAGAIKRFLKSNHAMKKNPAMRMFVVAFGIASILIEDNGPSKSNEGGQRVPKATTQNTDLRPSTKDNQATDLLNKLQQYELEIDKIINQYEKAMKEYKALFEQ